MIISLKKPWRIFTFCGGLSLLFIGLNMNYAVANSAADKTLPTPSLTAKRMSSALSQPWGLAFIDENTAVVTEKAGTLKLIKLNKNYAQQSAQVFNISTQALRINNKAFKQGIFTKGQGGLMDVAPSPEFAQNQTLFITYSQRIEQPRGGATTLATVQLKPLGKTYRLENLQTLLTSNTVNNKGYHFGSRISFDDMGHVFFSVGDRGVRDNSQDASTLSGVVIRLKLDGSIPKDNPFTHDKNKHPAIYSFGHRNPQGIAFDTQTSQLWVNEHGPRGGDEINLIQPGLNYGWPIISHGKEYWGPVKVGEASKREGYESPKHVYIPSIATSSLLIYRNNAYPGLSGAWLNGALAKTHINAVWFDKNNRVIKQQRFFDHLNERIRDIAQTPGGKLYFITDSGNLYRIEASQ